MFNNGSTLYLEVLMSELKLPKIKWRKNSDKGQAYANFTVSRETYNGLIKIAEEEKEKCGTDFCLGSYLTRLVYQDIRRRYFQ